MSETNLPKQGLRLPEWEPDYPANGPTIYPINLRMDRKPGKTGKPGTDGTFPRPRPKSCQALREKIIGNSLIPNAKNFLALCILFPWEAHNGKQENQQSQRAPSGPAIAWLLSVVRRKEALCAEEFSLKTPQYRGISGDKLP